MILWKFVTMTDSWNEYDVKRWSFFWNSLHAHKVQAFNSAPFTRLWVAIMLTDLVRKSILKWPTLVSNFERNKRRER
jgi:hypothetical protein